MKNDALYFFIHLVTFNVEECPCNKLVLVIQFVIIAAAVQYKQYSTHQPLFSSSLS